MLQPETHAVHNSVVGFREWKQAVSHGDSDRAIAARMGTNQMRVSRHLSSDSPVAETVIAFSRTYGVSPIEGLIAAGFLTRDDVQRASTTEALQQASGAELGAEVIRRLTAPGADDTATQSRTTRRERLGRGLLEE